MSLDRYINVDRGLQFSSWRELIVIFAYIICCCTTYISWHFSEFSAIGRHIVAVSVLFSFDWSRWDKFKVFLFVFLLICIFARRLLVIWSIMGLVYQIDYLRIPIKKIAIMGSIIIAFEIIIQIELLLLGIVANTGVFADKLITMVYDFGTGNSNRAGALVLFFVLCTYIVMKDSYRILFILFSISLSYLIFYITGSRTAFYGTIILNMTAISVWKGWLKGWMKWLLSILPILFFIGTFWLAATMDDNTEINTIASGRLYYIVKFTAEYTTQDWIMGAPVEINEPLDSSYLDIITKGGILLATFFSIGYGICIIRYFDQIKAFIPYILTLICAGLTETYFLVPNSVSIILWCFILIPYIREKPVIVSS